MCVEVPGRVLRLQHLGSVSGPPDTAAGQNSLVHVPWFGSTAGDQGIHPAPLLTAEQHTCQLPAPSWAELSSPYVAFNLVIKNQSCHLLPALQDILKQRCNCPGSGAPHSPNPGGQPVEFILATL